VTSYAPFVISGLVVGSVYAIAALGLVVTYRTTGLFNFAHGALGLVVAFAFQQLRVEVGLPTPLAMAIALLVVAPVLGVALDRFLFRGLADASQASKLVVTVALLVLVQGTILAIYGAQPRPVAPFLPTSTIRVGSVFVGWDQICMVAIGLAIFAGLVVFFRRARLGLAMRAVVDDAVTVETAGFPAARIQSFTWALGTTLAGLAGILFSPLLGLNTVALVLLVLQAYSAALFGRLRSLPRTLLGALGLGVVSSVLLRLLADQPLLLNGLRPSLPFLFLFAVLVFAKRGSLREFGVSAPWSGATAQRRDRVAYAVLPIAVLAVLLMPQARVFSVGVALVLACAFLSITVLTGSSGLLSLCQAGLVGAGAFAYAHLVNDAHLPAPLALVLAGVAVVPLGAAIAVPALRLPGLFIALATFGLGQLIDGLLFGSWSWFSGGGDGVRANRPSLLLTDQRYVLFLVVMVGLFLLVLEWVQSSGLGRALVAFRDSPASAQMLGINPLWPRLAAFCLSAFLAGVTGGLYLGLLQVASRTYFNTFTSLLWVTAVVVGGVASPLGALVGAFLLGFLPTVTSGDSTPVWLAPAFGAGAIALARRPGGLVEMIRHAIPRSIVSVRPPDPPPAEREDDPAALVGGGG
jgi:branched-subunit amino acid ABC-type transport system permease component